MRRIRLYNEQPMSADAAIELQGPAAHHLLKVLRRREGDQVTVFNGDGQEHQGQITAVTGRDRCTIQLNHSEQPQTESPLDITLIQAIGRGDRMDWALQKSVELGVTAIQPVFSERTEVRLSGARAEKRLEHWRSVVISACEQSGRVRIPELYPLRQLAELSADESPALFLDPEGARSLNDIDLDVSRPIRLAVGPEGGFGRKDVGALKALGFDGLRMGPRVLRTETAGPAVLAILQARAGDFT